MGVSIHPQYTEDLQKGPQYTEIYRLRRKYGWKKGLADLIFKDNVQNFNSQF